MQARVDKERRCFGLAFARENLSGSRVELVEGPQISSRDAVISENA